MTSTKHTPGPWRIEIGLLRDGHLAIAAGDYGIAKVWNEDPGNNCHADARLIAAAPDMLAALRTWEAAEAMTVGDGPDFDQRRAAKQQQKVRAHQMMRAAIAKAEGRS